MPADFGTMHAEEAASNVELLEIHYPELVRDPLRHQNFLKEFLNADRLPHAEKIADVVRPDLRRIRTTK